MDYLIRNVTIIPMTERDRYFVGDVGIKHGKIAFVGEDPYFLYDEVIDGTGKILMPGLINAHTHLSMVLMRNYKDEAENLMDWLHEIWPLEDKLTADDILKASRAGICECFKSGCTCFSDMYFFQEATLQACKEGSIRAVLGQTLFGDAEETERRFTEVLPKLLDAIGMDDRYRIDIAPHAIYTCTPETYRLAFRKAKELGCCVNTHLAETKGEVEDCVKAHGNTTLDYLDELTGLDAKAYLAHCVWLTEEEMDKCKAHGISVVHNPSSNAKLASGVMDLATMLEKGLNVALGTDGASSNNNLDMMEEMHVAALFATARCMKPSAVRAWDILSMATINGARALGLDDRIGTIEEGKDADIILIDTDTVNMTPCNNPISAVVYSAQSENVDTVFVKGEKVMEGRRILTLDEEKCMKEAREVWEDLLAR